MMKKITFFSLMLIIMSLFLTSCSSDDDSGTITKGSASAVVAGTYKGTYSSNEFNKTLHIENLGNNKIRISGNDKTPVELEVQFLSEYTDSRDVIHKQGELAGVFVYTDAAKTLKFSGKKISENQKLIFFSGTKQ